MDLVTVAQAFHWFDRAAFRQECQRLLKPGGQVALIWNDRLTNTPFLKAYEEGLHAYSGITREVNHRNLGEGGFSRLLHPGSTGSIASRTASYSILTGCLDGSTPPPMRLWRHAGPRPDDGARSPRVCSPRR